MAQQEAASLSPGTEGSEMAMGHQRLGSLLTLGSQFVSPQTPLLPSHSRELQTNPLAPLGQGQDDILQMRK